MEKKILIVEDEEIIREILRNFFEAFGYQVNDAPGGRQALALLEQEPRQVIFTDINMPDMDGLELCRQVRGRWPRASIYAITGYEHLFTRQECAQAGFDEYFKKPVNLHELHNAALRGFERLEDF